MALSGLDAALSGLKIAQQQLDTIANNVSNVSTPGYTRKILPQSTRVVGGAAIAVTANPIVRKVNLDLERDFWTQVSSVNYLDTQATYLDRIQEFHGPPELGISIAAELGKLRDTFSALADSPEETFLQRNVVRQAETVADKINDFSSLLTKLRNDSEEELRQAVSKVNTLLEQIAEANKEIKKATAVGKTTAAVEDKRDAAVKELANEMEVSFFIRGDGVMVVQTSEGVQLADENAETVFFDSSPLGPDSYYPSSANGLFVGGDPDKNPNAIDISQRGLNGHIGALIALRDDTLPRQQAMLDELAHKIALRFQAQGLVLFTDATGQIPADTAPVPNPPGPLAPVPYVGFSAEFRVNRSVLDDNSLVQQGTAVTDLPVQSGSNEVARRVVEFVFGEAEYQQATGTVDLRSSAGATDLQNWLGVFSKNQVTGTADATQYSDITALYAAGGNVFQPPAAPVRDRFDITFEELRTVPPLGPVTISVTLANADANFPIGGAITNAADQIVAEINNQIALAGVPAGLAASASVGPSGQIVINSRGDITVDASSFATGMGQDGLDFIGLTEGTSVTDDPYIEVQVGAASPVRIDIEPGDDETDLEAKLNKISAVDSGVPGLAVDPDVTNPLGNGFLILRPGDSTTAPAFGGDLKITGGPFTADGTGVVPGGITAGTSLVAALFGSDAPVASVNYASLTSTGAQVAFRTTELGPGANLNTGVISSTNILDYGQKLISRQTEEINAIAARQADETSFRELLQKRLSDESGVNMDEELSNMIVIQTAYAAAARIISAIDEQFRNLVNAI